MRSSTGYEQGQVTRTHSEKNTHLVLIQPRQFIVPEVERPFLVRVVIPTCPHLELDALVLLPEGTSRHLLPNTVTVLLDLMKDHCWLVAPVQAAIVTAAPLAFEAAVRHFPIN